MSGSKTSRWLDDAGTVLSLSSAWTDALSRLVTVPLLLLLVVVPSIEAAFGGIQSAIVTASVLAAALLFTRLPDVVEFSLWGLKGRLEKAVSDANATIQQLREVALAFAEASLSDLAAVGSIPSLVTIGQKFRIRDGIVASLRKLDVESADVVRVQRHWIATHCGWLAVEIAGTFFRLSGYRVPLPLEQLPNDDILGVPQPQVFRDLAKQRNLSDPGLSELLDEYGRLFSTGSMWNPDRLSLYTDVQIPPDASTPTD